MQTKSLKKLAAVTGATAEEFQTAFNAKMVELAAQGVEDPEVIFNPRQGHCCYITWHEQVQEIEGVADEFHLEGLRFLCGNCPLHEPVTDGRRKTTGCRYAELGVVHLEHEACELFYKMLKQGTLTPAGDGQIYTISDRKKHYQEIRDLRAGKGVK